MRVLLLPAALLAVACATAPTQTRFMEKQGVKVSSEALRTRLRSEAIPFTGLMEQAADAIRDGSTDPAVRRSTLLWKIDVVPALYRSLFNQHPMVALLDTWTLLLQAEAYLRSPPGQAAFGPGAAQLLATSSRMEGRVREIAAWAAPDRDLAQVRASLLRWVDAHPVERGFATRDGIEEYLSTIAPTEDLGLMVVAGRLNEDLDGFIARMDFLPLLVPRQATWQAELTYVDLVDPRLELALARGGKALDKFDDMLAWLGTEGLDGFAAAQREQLVQALDLERAAVEQFSDRKWREVEAFVQRERAEVALLVQQERAATMAEARKLVDHAAEEAARRAQEVVDHAIARLAMLLGAGLVAFALVGWAMRRKGRA